MDELIIREVLTKREKREFIYLPEKVHSNHRSWLPPIYMDEWLLYDTRRNKSYEYTDAVFYLAYRGKKPVGRIMGLINKRYNEIHNEKHGRFCFMECYEDQEVVHGLITKVEKWAKQNGMIKLVGPLGFSDKDPQGFQIEGFEYPYFITSATNFPYLPAMIEKEGYTKHVDLVNYLARMPKEIPPIYGRVLARISKNLEYRIVEFRNKKEIRPYIIPALELMNETFSEIYGFVPLTDKEKKDLAARYLPILDPRFIKIVENSTGLIGFAIAMPDVSEGIRKARGRMFPFGILWILRELRRSKKLQMMIGGVKKEFRGQGVDVMMAVKLIESAVAAKMEMADTHLILENNKRMRAEFERVGGTIVKRYRIYQKDI